MPIRASGRHSGRCMSSSPDTRQGKDKKILLLYLMYLAFLSAIFVVCGEVIVRYKGIEPWQTKVRPIEVDPGGRLFTRHSTLGYTGTPGSFLVTLPTGYSFRVTHLPSTLRITHRRDSYDASSQKPEIWIFGCSLTYGWSLNDEETFPWLLQETLPENEVVNFGVDGYGTVHSAMQFRDALKSKTPKVAVLAYAFFHDQRNTLSRMRRKSIVPHYRLARPQMHPVARVEDGKLLYSVEEIEYREFPLMRRLALAHYIETAYNGRDLAWRHGRSVSEAVIADMVELARKHQVKFVVAGIRGGQGMLEWAKSRGIPGVDISVDLTIRENTNLPHDGHPSAIAAKQYADRLETFLRANVLEDTE